MTKQTAKKTQLLIKRLSQGKTNKEIMETESIIALKREVRNLFYNKKSKVLGNIIQVDASGYTQIVRLNNMTVEQGRRWADRNLYMEKWGKEYPYTIGYNVFKCLNGVVIAHYVTKDI